MFLVFIEKRSDPILIKIIRTFVSPREDVFGTRSVRDNKRANVERSSDVHRARIHSDQPLSTVDESKEPPSGRAFFRRKKVSVAAGDSDLSFDADLDDSAAVTVFRDEASPDFGVQYASEVMSERMNDDDGELAALFRSDGVCESFSPREFFFGQVNFGTRSFGLHSEKAVLQLDQLTAAFITVITVDRARKPSDAIDIRIVPKNDRIKTARIGQNSQTGVAAFQLSRKARKHERVPDRASFCSDTNLLELRKVGLRGEKIHRSESD